jgi:hypothetical protein
VLLNTASPAHAEASWTLTGWTLAEELGAPSPSIASEPTLSLGTPSPSTASEPTSSEEAAPTSAVSVSVDAPALSAASNPPVLSVAGEIVQWSALGAESSYEVAISNEPRGGANRTTSYLTIPRAPGETQSYTPTLAPGETVYIGVSADNGLTWSEHEATVIAPKSEKTESTLGPPVLSVHGDTISWSTVPGAVDYELAIILNPTTTRNTTYEVVSGTGVTPPILPGQTVAYNLAANTTTEQGPWAHEVSISYPSSESPGESGELSAHKIIGTNDAAGWGLAAAQTILNAHITWNRVEIGSEDNSIASSISDGFHNLAIVGNIDDNTPLSQIEPASWAATVASQIKANPSIAIAEAGNEIYLKGNIANPVRYGEMYLDAVNALKAAGIHTPLLFNMIGDYPHGTWTNQTSWSTDENGGGWLHDAVAAVPGLANAILANGLSTHPYGAIGENHDDTNGTAAVTAQEAVAKKVLGATPPIYITEFGYNLGNCGDPAGACSQEEQASKLKAAYKTLLADPHVAGIWIYQSHDDSTGQWGFMNNDNTTRPSYNVLAEIAHEQGQ